MNNHANLDKRKLIEFIRNGISEDVGDGDHTSLACIDVDQRDNARLLVKDNGVIAGIAVAKEIFHFLDPSASFEAILNDGDEVKYGDIAFKINCQTRALLIGERLALNTMQRLSGIATLSRQFAKEVTDKKTTILDTRKTTPLLRFLEKWAVQIGGCTNYRDGLYDRIMIKDNHIAAAGSLSKAMLKVEEYLAGLNKSLEITLEVRTFEEISEALQLTTKPRLMLDNFSIEELDRAVKMIKGRFETEASGGIRLNDVRKIASTGVDFISVGALTHSAQCLDLSLKI